ncbi:MAG: hypothetical protein MJB14_22395, partial [Spirochaetes bacterium]|nr:hypothetical protein [Spirochaetota bacterium]
MKKNIFIVILIICLLSPLFSIYRTPEAGRYYFWLFSPELLSKGMGWGGIEKPSGIVINPASNAFIQNVKMEFSYGVAPGFWSTIHTNESFLTGKDAFFPFIANAGFVIPSRFGCFTGYFNYMNLSNQSFNDQFDYNMNNNDLGIGKIGAFYFGFSKDYNEHFAFGMDVNFKISYNPAHIIRNDSNNNEQVDESYNAFDVGGGLDFGFIFRPDWYVPFSKDKATPWGFQDFQFSIVLKELGKPLFNFNTPRSLRWFPTPFTVAVGLDFNILNTGSTNWKWLLDLSFPFFQNVVFALGTEVELFKFFVIRGSYTVDLEG